MDPSVLTNQELLAATPQAVATERESCANVIWHLAEMDRRDLYLDAGCTSLTVYCVEVLRYSQPAAERRVTAARLLAKYPMVLPMLRSGELHLTALRMLSPVLDDSNYVERLTASVGKTTSELERMIAGWRGGRAPKPARLRAVSEDTYELTMDIPLEDHTELLKAQALLRHAIPNGDIATIYRRAIHEMVEKLEARQFGKVKHPERAKQVSAEATESRNPDRPTRREVSERDGQQCAFLGVDGHRCSSKAWLQFDHRVRVVDGGPTDVKNIRLMCWSHNQGREKGHESRG